MKKFMLKTMFISVMSIAAIECVSGDVNERTSSNATWIDKYEINKVCKKNGGKIDNSECKANKLDAENICKSVKGRLATKDEFYKREKSSLENWITGKIYTAYDYDFNDDESMTVIPRSAHEVASYIVCGEEKDSLCIIAEGNPTSFYSVNCVKK